MGCKLYEDKRHEEEMIQGEDVDRATVIFLEFDFTTEILDTHFLPKVKIFAGHM